MSPQALRILIVGAGIGGLACAIACRRAGLQVQVLEKTAEFLPIGAGIQIPQNATRILREYGLLDKVLKEGVATDRTHMRRWQDGSMLLDRESNAKTGLPWIVIHRADYHRLLLGEAKRLGARIVLGAHVEKIEFENTKLFLRSGEVMFGDVIIAADGLWSVLRDQLLGHASLPEETGDLAYRATFSRSSLESLDDPTVTAFIEQRVATLWMGPHSHVVFYPIRSGQEFNLVLLCPDDLPASVRTQPGDLEQMRELLKGWDSILSKIISTVGDKPVLKWKLLHHSELEKWTQGSFAMLGDACHPSLPYQAQGAAMAVEDAAVLGTLLGLYQSSLMECRLREYTKHKQQPTVPEVLQLYEEVQKERQASNVRGAIANRNMYHMVDGPEQEQRDRMLRNDYLVDRDVNEEFPFVNSGYKTKLLGRDSIADAEKAWSQFIAFRG